MLEESDEFSFPTIAAADPTSSPDFTTTTTTPSSPLWSIPSPVSARFPKFARAPSEKEEPKKDQPLTLALSRARRRRSLSLSDGEGERRFRDEEERMDSLWEDFNDEEARRRTFTLGEAEKEMMMRRRSRSGVVAKRMRRRGAVLVVMLKVLKKFMLIQRSHCPKTMY